MKESPMIFTADSVRAILAGTKTQTRRVIKPQPPLDAQTVGCNNSEAPGGPKFFFWKGVPVDGPIPSDGSAMYWPQGGVSCPHGGVGDVIWVKETTWRNGGYVATEKPTIANDGKLSALFMPRWASRITLEIVGVRVERLQDITDEDARAEGGEDRWCECTPDTNCNRGKNCEAGRTDRDWYAALWDSLNAKRGFGWDANPFVWVYEFAPKAVTT
jgi:hypothetical protein